jgi:hypothetical protein
VEGSRQRRLQQKARGPRIEARHFGRELCASKALRSAANQQIYVLMAQLSQSAACTRFHQVEARLAHQRAYRVPAASSRR